jgi:hypothetical protein
VRIVRSIFVLVCVFAFASPSLANGTTLPLTLTAAGTAAPVGTPATGVLRFGPCGEMKSGGVLTTNEQPVDVAELPTTEEEGGGGCAEGGPTIEGHITRVKVRSTPRPSIARLIVVGRIIYTTHLFGHCIYKLTMLSGRFAIPGVNQARVAGVGRLQAGSEPGCAEKLKVGNTSQGETEARLVDGSTGELFEGQT